jgi:hypothetical protein
MRDSSKNFPQAREIFQWYIQFTVNDLTAIGVEQGMFLSTLAVDKKEWFFYSSSWSEPNLNHQETSKKCLGNT